MTEKKFYLQSSSPLQEIGMRAQVISFLIAEGIKEGNALNDPEDKKKVIVAVPADNEERINQVRSDLISHLNQLYKNDFCYQNFPRDITASELHELTNPHPVMVLPLNDLANSLMLEQTGKGVGAMKYPAGAITELKFTLEPLKELPEILKKLTAKLN